MAQFSMNRNDILKLALQMSGRVADNEDPTASQYSKAGDFINMLHSELMNTNSPLIQLELKSTSVSTVSFDLEAEDEDILIIYKSASSVDDIPMQRLSYHEYYGGLSDKTETGTPYSFYVDYQSTRKCYLYPVPSAATTIKYLAMKRFDKLSSATTEPMDGRYYSYLVYELARRLCDFYQVDVTRSAWLKAQAEELKSAATNKDKKRFRSIKSGYYGSYFEYKGRV